MKKYYEVIKFERKIFSKKVLTNEVNRDILEVARRRTDNNSAL